MYNYCGKYECVCARTDIHLYMFMYTYLRRVVRDETHYFVMFAFLRALPLFLQHKTSAIEHIINSQ